MFLFLKNKLFYSQITTFLMLFFFFFPNYIYADECFSMAAQRYSVPEIVLRAISTVESNGNEFALNIAGKGYYPSNLEKALEIINKSRDMSFDIGVMQINKWWFNKFDYSYSWGLNKCWNINFGAYILGYELNRAGGDLWLAIGRYHSPNKQRQAAYANKVWKEIKWIN